MKAKSLLYLATAAFVHAQGNLTPPGPPAASMKTLSQVEPRTDVLTLPGSADAVHIISAPGSYYLSGNLAAASGKSGIRISSSNVTLDLHGFHISGSQSNSLISGVQLSASQQQNITITNGSISGMSNGILRDSPAVPGSYLKNTLVSEVHVANCANFGIGLTSARTTRVTHCSVQGGLVSIQAGSVSHCSAETGLSGQDAILASGDVSHSTGIATGSQTTGITAGGSVTDCMGTGAAAGIIGGSVKNSLGETNDGSASGSYGIFSDSNVENCIGDAFFAFGGWGIYATGNVSSSRGLSRDGSGIEAQGNVQNSVGTNMYLGSGIEAKNVENSSGITESGIGIYAGSSVSNSTGYADDRFLMIGSGIIGISARIISFSHGEVFGATGPGLVCTLALGCTSSGGNIITNKYQMP